MANFNALAVVDATLTAIMLSLYTTREGIYTLIIGKALKQGIRLSHQQTEKLFVSIAL